MTLEKKYNGAPFGQQADRFSSSGVHPRNRKPGTFLHLSNKARSTSADVGPGKYDPEYGGFSEKAVADRALGPGWERQYEVSRMTALPYLLNKEEWEMKKFLKNKLGPGSYFTKDILKESIKKPVSKRGMLSMRETRFKDDLTSDIPGPGTYGKGGIPHAVLEEKERQSFGTVGMLECGGSGVRSLPNMGSQLGPGTYNFEGSVDHLLKKTVGLRGAYDVFSIDRSKPIPTGHYSVLVSNKLGPGQYESKSTFDDLNSHSKKYQGRFGKLDRTSGATCDRIIACTLSVCPRDPSDPGPGQYEASNPNHRPLTQGKNLPAFLSSTQRTDKTATKFFTGNFNPVGTGRYDIQKFEEAQDINGHQSIFRSKTTPPNGVRKKFMEERLKCKSKRTTKNSYLARAHTSPQMTWGQSLSDNARQSVTVA